LPEESTERGASCSHICDSPLHGPLVARAGPIGRRDAIPRDDDGDPSISSVANPLHVHALLRELLIFTNSGLKVRLRVNSEDVNLKNAVEQEFRIVLGDVWDLQIVGDGGPVDAVI
jgi:hypothetical protein